MKRTPKKRTAKPAESTSEEPFPVATTPFGKRMLELAEAARAENPRPLSIREIRREVRRLRGGA